MSTFYPEGCCTHLTRIYVADCFNHRVVVFSPALHFLFAFAHEGKGRGELRYPRGVAYLGGGELVVACEANPNNPNPDVDYLFDI